MEEKNLKKKFRIHSNVFFLTYRKTNTDETCKSLWEKILEKFPSKDLVKNYLIVEEISHSEETEEKGKEGYKHFHVYILLHKRLDIHKENYFDIICKNDIESESDNENGSVSSGSVSVSVSSGSISSVSLYSYLHPHIKKVKEDSTFVFSKMEYEKCLSKLEKNLSLKRSEIVKSFSLWNYMLKEYGTKYFVDYCTKTEELLCTFFAIKKEIEKAKVSKEKEKEMHLEGQRQGQGQGQLEKDKEKKKGLEKSLGLEMASYDKMLELVETSSVDEGLSYWKKNVDRMEYRKKLLPLRKFLTAHKELVSLEKMKKMKKTVNSFPFHLNRIGFPRTDEGNRNYEITLHYLEKGMGYEGLIMAL